VRTEQIQDRSIQSLFFAGAIFTALLLIALVCITIPVGATDAQNSTANTTTLSIPVGNQTVDETNGNSTPAISVPYEPTASPVVTTTPLTTSTLLAEDPIKAMSTVARPGISEIEPAPPGATPAALFVGTPVSGIGPQAGYWTFEILDDIYANSRITINGDSDPAHYQTVSVSNDIDIVTVTFVVNAGHDTTVTIKKSYVDYLKIMGHDFGYGDTPMLHAWGSIQLYDVDLGLRTAVSSTTNNFPNAQPSTSFTTKFTPIYHLESRGTVHDATFEAVTEGLGTNTTPILPAYRRFIMGPNDANIPGTNIWVNANATLINMGSTLSYAVKAGASEQVPGIFITPQIWKHTDTGDVLIYTGSPSGCWEGTSCGATGTYMPSDSGTYWRETLKIEGRAVLV